MTDLHIRIIAMAKMIGDRRLLFRGLTTEEQCDLGAERIKEIIEAGADKKARAIYQRKEDDERQGKFEFLKEGYPNEAGALTKTDDLTVATGMFVIAALLEDADNWNVPRYRDQGEAKRKEAKEVEQRLRERFGDTVVENALHANELDTRMEPIGRRAR
jgi:hypothetical protein